MQTPTSVDEVFGQTAAHHFAGQCKHIFDRSRVSSMSKKVEEASRAKQCIRRDCEQQETQLVALSCHCHHLCFHHCYDIYCELDMCFDTYSNKCVIL